MERLHRIQRISAVLRYLSLLAGVGVCAALVYVLLVPSQQLITLGDGQLLALHRAGAIGPSLMLALLAPIGITLILGVYWLQRLFKEYQQGQFFSEGTVRCYVWLVWLKAAGFVYGIVLPWILGSLSPAGEAAEVAVTIEPGTLVELIVLILIVHVLREAQQIDDENKAFI